MILENEEDSIDKALVISVKLIEVMKKELSDLSIPDDPREIIYIALHTIGSFLARMTIILKNYSNVYEGEDVAYKILSKTIISLYQSYLKLNKNIN